MNLKAAVKKRIFQALYKSGLVTWRQTLNRGHHGLILALHRVIPSDQRSQVGNQAIETSIQFLGKFIEDARNHGYQFVDLDCYMERFHGGTDHNPVITVGLDDGYLDNKVYGYPLFKKLDVPFCIYATTDFLDHKADLWWYQLEALIVQCNRIEDPDQTKLWPCTNLRQKNHTFRNIRLALKAMNRDQRADYFGRQQSLWQIRIPQQDQLNRRLCLDWQQVKQLNSDPLVTIGAHSLSHPALSLLPEVQAAQEINLCKERLESYLGQSVHHFAYPFGDPDACSSREFDLAFASGYRSAVTTTPGRSVFEQGDPNLKSSCFHLPRYLLDEDSGLEGFWLESSGLKDDFRKLINRPLKRPQGLPLHLQQGT